MKQWQKSIISCLRGYQDKWMAMLARKSAFKIETRNDYNIKQVFKDIPFLWSVDYWEYRIVGQSIKEARQAISNCFPSFLLSLPIPIWHLQFQLLLTTAGRSYGLLATTAWSWYSFLSLCFFHEAPNTWWHGASTMAGKPSIWVVQGVQEIVETKQGIRCCQESSHAAKDPGTRSPGHSSPTQICQVHFEIPNTPSSNWCRIWCWEQPARKKKSRRTSRINPSSWFIMAIKKILETPADELSLERAGRLQPGSG